MTGTGGLLLLALSALISGSSGILAALLLKVRGRVEQVIAVGLLISAQLVLIAQALSIFEWLRPGFFLAGQVLLAAVIASLWMFSTDHPRDIAIVGRVRSGLRREHLRVAAHACISRVRTLSFSQWTLICFAAIVAGVVLFELYLALTIAPNNYDSLTYHLSRAAYWLQFHTIEQFSGGTARQNTFPPNAEILNAWTMLLTRGDQFTQVIQWISMLGVSAAVYCWALLLGWRREAALFAALVFTLLTLVIFEATSTQNDLVLTFFLIAAALFLYRGIRDPHKGELLVGAIAFGLAVGTKTSALFMLPGIVLLAAVAARWRLTSLIRPAAMVLVGVLLLGSFSYIQNLSHGYIFGDVKTEQRTKSVDEALDNLSDIVSKLADSGGYKQGWLDKLRLPRPPEAMSEDVSAFGPVGILVLPPLILFSIFAVRREPLRRWLALAAISFLVLFGLVYKENEYAARLLLPFAAFTAPLIAGVWSRQVIAGIVISLSLLAMFPALLTNPNKPVMVPPGVPNIFGRSHQEQQTIVNGDVNEALNNMRPLLSTLDRVAVAGTENTSDYPYFGEHFDRDVIRVDPFEMNAGTFRTSRVQLVIWADLGPPSKMPGVHVRQVARVIWELTPG